MNRAVAVTGATGFIGTHLVDRLLQDGWSVRALVRRASPSLEARGAGTVVGDLEDEKVLAELVAGVTAVVHCAGAVMAPRRAVFHAVNVEGTARLVAAVGAAERPPRLLLLSSLAAREPQLSDYAASKRLAEDVLASLAAGDNWCIIRLPAVYGPGDRVTLTLFRQMARGFLCTPVGDDSRFSLLYVDDLATAVSALVDRANRVRNKLELDDGQPGGYSWANISDIAGGVLGRPIRRVPTRKSALWVPAVIDQSWARATGRSPTLTLGKLRELFHRNWVSDKTPTGLFDGWAPSIRFKEGFARTFAWYEARGML